MNLVPKCAITATCKLIQWHLLVKLPLSFYAVLLDGLIPCFTVYPSIWILTYLAVVLVDLD